jgi:hypothetical protein
MAERPLNHVRSASGTWRLDIETSNARTSDTAKNSLEGTVHVLEQIGVCSCSRA